MNRREIFAFLASIDADVIELSNKDFYVIWNYSDPGSRNKVTIDGYNTVTFGDKVIRCKRKRKSFVDLSNIILGGA